MTPARGRSHCATGFVERGVQRSWVLMLVNFVLSVPPMPLTTAMMATEMPAAMRPYSMAVAPDSSFTNRETRVFMALLFLNPSVRERFVQRSWVLMLENFVFNVVPMPLTTAMITTEMPAAMRPYSMAVAPDWSFTNRETRVFIG